MYSLGNAVLIPFKCANVTSLVTVFSGMAASRKRQHWEFYMSDLKKDALAYHADPKPGKLSIELTTPAETSRDLSLAYSPGVAEPVKAIAENPDDAFKYTIKGNLVAVISNGTAILGLGALGSLASKPVMEGKSLLFKRFANVDSIDIEIDSTDVDEIVRTVELIAETFGGINLEDIKAPECFEVERQLKEKCNIPVFHDDQHGTAIVTVAGMLNALEIQGKKIEEATMVCIGAVRQLFHVVAYWFKQV